MKIDIPVAIKILERTGSVKLTGYHWYNLIRRIGKLEQSRWLNCNHQYPHLGSPNPNKENTYNDCVTVTLTPHRQKNCLWATIVVWDGDILHGQKTTERCYFGFAVNTITDEMENLFHSLFDRLVEDAVEHREEQRIQRLRTQCRLALMDELS